MPSLVSSGPLLLLSLYGLIADGRKLRRAGLIATTNGATDTGLALLEVGYVAFEAHQDRRGPSYSMQITLDSLTSLLRKWVLGLLRGGRSQC